MSGRFRRGSGDLGQIGASTLNEENCLMKIIPAFFAALALLAGPVLAKQATRASPRVIQTGPRVIVVAKPKSKVQGPDGWQYSLGHSVE
jgi:hypothetical protein